MKETREQIIALADQLIRTKGFNAFSYADIAQTLSIRNSAIHYHFPTKSQLGQAVIAEEQDRLMKYRLINRHLSGEQQLKHLVTTFYSSSRMGCICLMGALSADFATFDELMRFRLSGLSGVVREWVAWCLEDARSKGRLRFEGAAADRALLSVSTLISALLLSRVDGESIFRQVMDRMLEDMGADWRVADLPVREAAETHSFT